MGVGVEATSGEDAADLARVITDVPIAIEMRLEFNRHSPGTVIMTARGGDAAGGQRRVGVGTWNGPGYTLSARTPAQMTQNLFVVRSWS